MEEGEINTKAQGTQGHKEENGIRFFIERRMRIVKSKSLTQSWD